MLEELKKALRLAELVLRYGLQAAKRILHLEELLESLMAAFRACMRVAERYKAAAREVDIGAAKIRELGELEARALAKAREAEVAAAEAERAIERLKQGLSEGGPFPH